MNLETEYKDFKIRYSESYDKWEVVSFNDKHDTLLKAKDFIDKQLKVKYKEISVFKTTRGGYPYSDLFSNDLEFLIATRPHNGWNKDRKEFWVKNSEGKRSTTGDLYLDNDNNRQLIPKIINYEVKMNELNSQKKILIDKLEKLTELEPISK